MPTNIVKGFNVGGSTVQYDYESLSDRLLKSSIGEIYSSLSTYKVDEYVLYAGQLYRCIVEVTTPQNFDSSKWEAVSVGDDLKYIKKYFCIDDGIKQALLNLLSHVAYTDEHGQDYLDNLEAELFRTADLVSISAVFNQGQNVIYDTDSLDTLKQYLVVTATYDDSSTGIVTGYTLSGTLTAGTSTITVSYGGKTATFEVTVTAVLYAFQTRKIETTDYTLETTKAGHVKLTVKNNISYGGASGIAINIYGGTTGALNDPNTGITNQPKTFTIPANASCVYAISNIVNQSGNTLSLNLYKANAAASAGTDFSLSATTQDASKSATPAAALDIYTPFIYITVSNNTLPAGFVLECDLSLTVGADRYF